MNIVWFFFFSCFEKHDDSVSEIWNFESKFSNGNPTEESSFESEEVAYSKKKSYCNEFALYFESDSKIEVFSLGHSNSQMDIQKMMWD
jgi:hypothetical protein